MPETPPRKKDTGKRKGKEAERLSDKARKIGGEKETWAQDQREKNYYYDDAHGYEIYNADEDGEED